MILKKKILLILCSVFISIAAIGHGGNSTGTERKPGISIISKTDNSNDDRIVTIDGLLNPIVKVNENTPSFKNFKEDKKDLFRRSSCRSSGFLNTWFNSYSASRSNCVRSSPFYIVYHRLTI